jgi:hypothetical protein
VSIRPRRFTLDLCLRCSGVGRIHYEITGDIERDLRTYKCPLCKGGRYRLRETDQYKAWSPDTAKATP